MAVCSAAVSLQGRPNNHVGANSRRPTAHTTTQGQ
jgi:hypothetical protein